MDSIRLILPTLPPECPYKSSLVYTQIDFPQLTNSGHPSPSKFKKIQVHNSDHEYSSTQSLRLPGGTPKTPTEPKTPVSEQFKLWAMISKL